MTVPTAPVEEEEKKPEKGWPPTETKLGIIAAVLGIIMTILPFMPSFVKAIGLTFVLVWGADSVRKTSRYGLGTGVPSIGVLAVGYGVIGAIAGMGIAKVGGDFTIGGVEVLNVGVLGGVAIAALIGYISGIFSNSEKFISMKIPGLERGMTELGVAGTLAFLLESSMVAGTLKLDAVLEDVFLSGAIAFMFVMSAIGMFHPFNACLGPDEDRGRTLLLSFEISGLICIILGIVSIALGAEWLGSSSLGLLNAALLILYGIVVWVVFYAKFVRRSFEASYEVVGTGLIKTVK
ncbi:MAG: tetrahydromethanopterin S-methyltransferase subunit C [Canidatus Methanoxibalbensis ujae]|nr:tetrahydromethanopterin S-methyltransferase subunit C [Candidatus Methanoxibalbensis ujae]MCW7078850.1 tetrahydromethanopterin S-methyltransferase subunit C [Candidatus Methanoxibalbensis ujae]